MAILSLTVHYLDRQTWNSFSKLSMIPVFHPSEANLTGLRLPASRNQSILRGDSSVSRRMSRLESSLARKIFGRGDNAGFNGTQLLYARSADVHFRRMRHSNKLHDHMHHVLVFEDSSNAFDDIAP